MSVNVQCGKCGAKIATMRVLKPLRDIMVHNDGKCPECGEKLSSSEFSLDIQDI